MATSFASRVTVIAASWLNSVASLVEDVFASATTPAQARTAISVDSSAEVTAKDDAIYAALASTDSGNGADLVAYPLSAGEIAASATIVNAYFPPGNVLRYGTLADVKADIGVYLQIAIDASLAGSGDALIVIPPVSTSYAWATPVVVDFTTDKSVEITIQGHGDGARLDATAAIDMLTLVTTTGNARRLYLKNLFFNLASTATAGVVFDQCAYDRIMECQFVNHGSGKGVRLVDCAKINIAYCYFLDANNSASVGISLESTSENNLITGCVFGEGIGYGVFMDNGTVAKNIITGNLFNGCVKSMYLYHSDSNQIIGNIFDNSTDHMIEIYGSKNLIQGNQFRDYGSSNAATNRCAIHINTLDSTQSNYNMILGNEFNDADATASRIHVRIVEGSGTANNNVIQNNYFDSSATPISDAGHTTVARNNSGWVTESSGADTIASGATSKTVTHGLSVTPAYRNISITFMEQGDNDYGRWWISNPTSTEFTLNVSANPGASGLDFGWQAIVI